jgi:hypothetical protein
MYNVLETKDSSNNAMTIMQTTAAATTGSTLGNMYQNDPSTVPQELTTVINALVANQQLLFQHMALLMQHMAAMLFQMRQPMQTPANPSFRLCRCNSHLQSYTICR